VLLAALTKLSSVHFANLPYRRPSRSDFVTTVLLRLFAPTLASMYVRGRAPEQRDECAVRPHSITSSARASRVGGTSRPSALAVLRLMISSYLVGACTGRSAGFSPLRMRST
jgi:hypothetical protein